MTARERFDAHVTVGATCPMEWAGPFNNAGYGTFWLAGRKTTASRAAYLLAGAKLQPGELVRHRCDNPRCVTPDHLLAGTYLDNLRDAQERNRRPIGERCHHARLRDEQVLGIFPRLAGGEGVGAIARSLGVPSSHVSNIIAGRKWARLTCLARERLAGSPAMREVFREQIAKKLGVRPEDVRL